MKRRKLTPSEVKDLFAMATAGMKPKDIAEVLQCHRDTIYKILRGDRRPHRKAHDSTADRYEYFQGDEAYNTGNFHNDNPIYNHPDPTFEEVAFMEELELGLVTVD